jgi:tetraprenyl-beta-curcumene synthase
VSGIGDRWFAARAGVALVIAQVRYWSSVAPVVRKEFHHWEGRAAEICDPKLQSLAVEKLREERFNFEACAMAATIAPAGHRDSVVQAIVALQVMFDYLDALTEQPSSEPLRDGLMFSRAYLEAVTVSAAPTGDYYSHYAGAGDGGYLTDLARTVHGALLCLPAVDAIAEALTMSADRCVEAQVRVHAAASSGVGALEDWAKLQANGTEFGWQEWLFGAMSSVVAAHALIAAAASDATTHEQALELDSTYLSLCVLTTALDQLVDHEQDALAGDGSYLDLYANREAFEQQTSAVAARALQRTRTLPHGAHHAMILAGIVAYYISQPSALGDFARPATEQVRDQLRPLITPTLATMHIWRLAKRTHRSWRTMRSWRPSHGPTL